METRDRRVEMHGIRLMNDLVATLKVTTTESSRKSRAVLGLAWAPTYSTVPSAQRNFPDLEMELECQPKATEGGTAAAHTLALVGRVDLGPSHLYVSLGVSLS